MKKRISVLMSMMLALILALTFGACGTGTVADEAETTGLDILGAWEFNMNMAEYIGIEGIDHFPLIATMEFSDDGTYSIGVSEEALRASLVENIDSIIDVSIKETGLEMTTDEFLALLGMTRESFVDYVLELGNVDADSFTQQGEYTFDGGVLTIDGDEVDYEYDGDTLTMIEDEISLILTRVSE